MSTGGNGGESIGDYRLTPEQVEAWRQDQAKAGPSVQPKAKRGKEQFIMVSLVWKVRLRQARHAASFKLALHLIYLAWKTGERSIQLSNAVAGAAGVTRRSKWRALSELDRLGLVVVERRSRRSPMVTILAGGKS